MEGGSYQAWRAGEELDSVEDSLPFLQGLYNSQDKTSCLW